MISPPYRVLCYFARQHGLAGLQALIREADFQAVCVVTHRRNPRSEDSERRERPDFSRFQELAGKHDIPVLTVDSKQARDGIIERLEAMQIDLIASISWRMLITPRELAIARIGGVNLHRGKLPEYPGAYPLQRAIENGDNKVSITAHLLAEEIDAGKVLSVVEHPIGTDCTAPVDEQVAILKEQITPYFGPLLISALRACIDARA